MSPDMKKTRRLSAAGHNSYSTFLRATSIGIFLILKKSMTDTNAYPISRYTTDRTIDRGDM